MSAADRIRAAMELVTEGADRWGSDDCGCDECKTKRALAKVDVVKLLIVALHELGAPVFR